MYKGTSHSLQRRNGVHMIAPQKGFIMDDVLPDACTLSMAECLDERVRLKSDLARLENEVVSAKGRGRMRDVRALGSAKQSIDQRLGILADRVKALRFRSGEEVYRKAIAEVCPEHADAIEELRLSLEKEVAA